MNYMKKILWLPAWYPNRIEPLSGDFIQRHARAASMYCQVDVIFVVRDKKGIVTKNVHEEVFESGNLHEKIIYYYSVHFFIPVIDKIIAAWKYKKICKQFVRDHIEKKGKPDCSHVHVADKNGNIALWLKHRFKIPYILSEHWTIYLPEAKPNFSQMSFWFLLQWRKIIKNVSAITTVSAYLGNTLSQIKKGIDFSVIPNVVDENLFYPIKKNTNGLVHFIHASNLNYQKNPEAILEAFALVKKATPSFLLSVFGPENENLKLMTAKLHLEDNVSFCGEVPQAALAALVQKADALILYSRYETFGCVVIEANTAGLPVIVSDIPVFHELVEDGVNGYFVPGENSAELARKITWFMEHRNEIQRDKIAETAKEKYCYKTVGKLFSALYASVLKY